MPRSGRPFSACLITALALAPAYSLAQTETKETLHVVITGGKSAGTYDAVGTKGGCSTGANGPGSWGNAFSLPTAGATDLASLSLIVPDAKAASLGAKEFFLAVGFGPIMKRSAELDVETRTDKKPSGTGKITVKDAGATAMVNIDALTADGVKIHATIDCKTVVRVGGL